MDLEQFAHCQAASWTELVWKSFVSERRALPSEWPGSIEQARFLIAICANRDLDAGDSERLVEIIQQRARTLWQEFRSLAGPVSPGARMIATRSPN